MIHTVLLMAQPDGGGSGQFMGNIVLFAAIIGIFYFMIIRPQQKRTRERDVMLNALKKGDKIVTSGGIHGSIVGMDDKTLLVQIADNVKVKVDRSAIASAAKEGE